MVIPQQRSACYEDLFSLPDNVVGEIIGGELHTHPRPAPRHAMASSIPYPRIGGALQQGAGRWSWRLVDSRRAGASPRPRHPRPGYCGLAPRADAGPAGDRLV